MGGGGAGRAQVGSQVGREGGRGGGSGGAVRVRGDGERMWEGAWKKGRAQWVEGMVQGGGAGTQKGPREEYGVAGRERVGGWEEKGKGRGETEGERGEGCGEVERGGGRGCKGGEEGETWVGVE